MTTPDSGEVDYVTDQEKRAMLERQFLGEALGVLADAGVDLLELEVSGRGVDQAVLARLARITQAMRGGAGLLGLDAMHELALVLEAVLDLARHEVLPLDTDVVTAIERGMDAFSSRLKAARDSHEVPLQEGRGRVKDAVSLLTAAVRTPVDARILAERHRVRGPGVDAVFNVGGHDLRRAAREGLRFYVLGFDVDQDLRQKDISPLGLLVFLQKSGEVVDARFTCASGGRCGMVGVLFSSILDADLLGAVFQIDAARVFSVDVEAVRQGALAWKERVALPPGGVTLAQPGEPDSKSIELLLLQYDAAMQNLRERSMQDDFEPYDMNGNDDAASEEVSGSLPLAENGAGVPVSGADRHDAGATAAPTLHSRRSEEGTPDDDAGGAFGFFAGAPGVAGEGSGHAQTEQDGTTVWGEEPVAGVPAASGVQVAASPEDAFGAASTVAEPAGDDMFSGDALAGEAASADAASASLLFDLESEFDMPLLQEAVTYGGELDEEDAFGVSSSQPYDSDVPADAPEASSAARGGDTFEEYAGATGSLSADDPDLDFFRDDAPPPDLSHLDLPRDSEHSASGGADGIMLDLGDDGEAEGMGFVEELDPGGSFGLQGALPEQGGDAMQPASAAVSPPAFAGVPGEPTSGGFAVREYDGGATLVLTGELTIERSVALRDALLEMLDRYRHVRLDLTDVSEVDLTFFQLLRAAVVTAQRRGVTLTGSGITPSSVQQTAARAGLDAAAIRRAGFEQVLDSAF